MIIIGWCCVRCLLLLHLKISKLCHSAILSRIHAENWNSVLNCYGKCRQVANIDRLVASLPPNLVSYSECDEMLFRYNQQEATETSNRSVRSRSVVTHRFTIIIHCRRTFHQNYCLLPSTYVLLPASYSISILYCSLIPHTAMFRGNVMTCFPLYLCHLNNISYFNLECQFKCISSYATRKKIEFRKKGKYSSRKIAFESNSLLCLTVRQYCTETNTTTHTIHSTYSDIFSGHRNLIVDDTVYSCMYQNQFKCNKIRI